MTLTIPDWIASNAAWVTMVSLAGGYGTYLLKRSKITTSKRMDDKVIEQLVTLVKDNTAAFQAMKSQQEDHKNVTVTVCGAMQKIETALALVNAGMQQLLQKDYEPAHAHHARRNG